MFLCCFNLFFYQILSRCGNPGWCLGFYFWLDFAATVSLIPDIGWIWDPLFAALSGESSAAGGDGNGAQDALKAGRSSRSGAKAGRVVRIVRLVRMVRMVKLYKMHGNTEASAHLERRMTQKESKVGSILSEKTTRKVIVLVLVLILFLPQFDGFNETTNSYHRGGLMNLHSWAHDMNCYSNIHTQCADGLDVANCHGEAEAAEHRENIMSVGSEEIAPFVVSKKLFRPLVHDYARRVGRLMYLEISGLGPSLYEKNHESDKNTSLFLVQDTRWTSSPQQSLLDLLPSAPAGDSVAVKYEALTSPLTNWGDTNYDHQATLKVRLLFLFSSFFIVSFSGDCLLTFFFYFLLFTFTLLIFFISPLTTLRRTFVTVNIFVKMCTDVLRNSWQKNVKTSLILENGTATLFRIAILSLLSMSNQNSKWMLD